MAMAQTLPASRLSSTTANGASRPHGLKSALPIKYQAPDLNAAGNDAAIEELTPAHEGLARDPPSQYEFC
jgi:hypothetical protein